MAISKVELNGTTLMDVTSATASSDKILTGYTAMIADGTIATGTATAGMTIDQWAQTGATGEVTLNSATTIRGGAFNRATLTSISSDTVTKIKSYAFSTALSLEHISFPNVTEIDDYAFEKVNALYVAHFPKLTKTGTMLFSQTRYGWNPATAGNRRLVVVMPKVSTLGQQNFRQCVMDAVDLGPTCKNLTYDTFYYTAVAADADKEFIKTVILRSTTLVTAANRDGVRNVHTVYIPKVLYDHLDDGTSSDYNAATNWATDKAKRTFYPIEDSIYETAYADGTPCPQSITNTLTNVTSSNTDTSVVAGEAYSTTLTPIAGYTISSVTVMMKRVDVTSTVYNSSTGVISIAEVTGPIVITATAT